MLSLPHYMNVYFASCLVFHSIKCHMTQVHSNSASNSFSYFYFFNKATITTRNLLINDIFHRWLQSIGNTNRLSVGKIKQMIDVEIYRLFDILSVKPSINIHA